MPATATVDFLSRWLTPFHLTYFGLFLPWRAVELYRRKPPEPFGPPPRMNYFLAMGRTLQLGVLSLVTAWATGVLIFVRAWPSAADIGWGVIAGSAMILASLPPWRQAVATTSRRVARWIPRDRSERLQWVLLCVIVGFTEEVTWRGVQFALLQRILRSWPLAAVVCSLMFGVIHVTQGRRWMYTATGFALLLQALVWMTGSLYAAMVIHAVTDIAAGFYIARRWPRSSYPFTSPSAAQ